jgi:hypothetical protein
MPSFAGIRENLPQNADSAAMVQVGGRQKELGNMQKVRVQEPRMIYYIKRAIVVTSTANSS